MTKMKTISHDELKEKLHYDNETGLFTWNYSCGRRITKGCIAGTLASNGYVVICINKSSYKAHRLAWLYVYGEMPNGLIDHINRNPSDNRICNLRESTYSQNQFNKGLTKNNSSGYKGVCFNKYSKKWMASIRKDNKDKFLGYFDTAIDASEAYLNESIKLHGEFHYANIN